MNMLVLCAWMLSLSNRHWKANDYVEWPFILTILEALGLGSFFINAIEILFVEAFAFLSINRCKSEWIELFKPV